MFLQQKIQEAQKRLTQAGVENPSLDARLLIARVLGLDRAALLAQTQRLLTEEELAAIEALIARRAAREPVGRILGQREFWGLPFMLNEATLEPRPDTETVVEVVLKHAPSSAARLLDLGTGTGCLLLALLHEQTNATGLGIDSAPRAVEQAKANAAQLGLESRATFQVGNWFENVPERFDVIVSNPPYIPSAEVEALAPEVRRFDPHAALDGGADGLAPYREIVPQLRKFLQPSGLVCFEVGQGQASSVAALLAQEGFIEIATHDDLGGIARAVSGFAPT